MKQLQCTVAVVGGGPAGLAAACAAKEAGAPRVVVIERDSAAGGILQQCIHPGFGLTYFNEELTGPEYAAKFYQNALAHNVEFLFGTTVLSLAPNGALDCVSAERGTFRVEPGATVLAMGCRERTRGNIQIPGTRPAGIFTAGAAQRLINRQNKMVGRRCVILGSGDIGMIMARRLTLEGAEVVAVIEIMDYLAGLTRNRVQCLDDFGIPLLLSHTVTRVVGNERVEGVWVSAVDGDRKPVGEETFYACDTLLLSVGLIPENELTRGAGAAMDSVTGGPSVNQWMQTSLPNIFASGNVVHVNDLADNVSAESLVAGKNAALFAMGRLPEVADTIPVRAGAGVRYVCPETVARMNGEAVLSFRVLAPLCSAEITITCGDVVLATKKTIKLTPGEMERMTISLRDVCGEECVVAVKGERV